VQKFNQKDVKVVNKETLYTGFLSTVKYQLQHRLFAGDWSPVIDRELMERGHAVVVIPYDPERDELIVLEQFRVGAMETSESPWLLEFVAGMRDAADQTNEAVAERELLEEAGLKAHQLHFALSYLSSPGGTSERIYIYIAEVDASSAASHGGLADEHEDIRVHRLPRTTVEALLEAGKIDNAASVIGLQWLMLNRQRFIKEQHEVG